MFIDKCSVKLLYNEQSFIYLCSMRVRDEEKIPRIYKAAIKVINRDGFEGCSMAKIATEAEVCPATIYLYFENKKDMLNKLFVHIKEGLANSYFAANTELSVSKATFRKIYINYYQYIINNVEEFILTENYKNSPLIEMVDKEFRIDYCPVFESLFERSRKEKLLKELSNDMLYSLLFSPLNYLLKKTVNNKSTLNTKDLMDIFDASWQAISL